LKYRISGIRTCSPV
jgi:hypothetical protein